MLSVESHALNFITPLLLLLAELVLVQTIMSVIVRKGIDATVTDGIDETVAVEATVKFGIEETVTVEDSSAIAVPELLELSDELLTALLQTERTTAKVHTSTSCHRRFFLNIMN